MGFGIAGREVGQQAGGDQNADAIGRPTTGMPLFSAVGREERLCDASLQAREIMIAERADDELPASERDLVVATGADRSEVTAPRQQ